MRDRLLSWEALRLVPWGRARVSLLLIAACCSCGVDERELSLAAAGSDSGSSPPSTGGGSSSSAGGGGEAGEPAGLDAPPAPECTYVGSKIDEGCETLVSNPGFDKTAVGWPGENLAVLTGWDNRDKAESEDSGSIVVDNRLTGSSEIGEVMIGAQQCVGAVARRVYDVRADLFIPEQETKGRAGLSVLFYKTGDCNSGQGGTDMSFTTELTKTTGEWQPVIGRFVVPDDVNSMEVRLIAAKPFAPESFQVLFDNVLVQQK